TLQSAAPLPQPKERTLTSLREDAKEPVQPETAEPTAQTRNDANETRSTTDSKLPEAAPTKVVYKADRFRKLDNGMSVYEPGKLRGPSNTNVIMLAVLALSLALRPRKQLGALALFVAMTGAWLLVPALCSVLLFVTGAPWAALRIAQVFPVAFYALVLPAPLLWLSRVPRASAWITRAELPLAAAALAIGSLHISHGEAWTPERLWEHALGFEARAQWGGMSARQALLCGPIPKGEVVMAHPRWDYGLPMLCRNSVIALAPGRGWHGLPYMHERRADVDEFFHERTTGQRRIELMRKYQARYVYTSQRIARRIVRSSPKTSKILAEARPGAVLEIDTQDTQDTQAGD
ncbi:MAG TPA: hypothetical protein VMF89_31615, partial [Polyangiales bacterium]|nr:hypothetical protein [Polyangiales bacterium]